jgi:hypothetical protein
VIESGAKRQTSLRDDGVFLLGPGYLHGTAPRWYFLSLLGPKLRTKTRGYLLTQKAPADLSRAPPPPPCCPAALRMTGYYGTDAQTETHGTTGVTCKPHAKAIPAMAATGTTINDTLEYDRGQGFPPPCPSLGTRWSSFLRSARVRAAACFLARSGPVVFGFGVCLVVRWRA